ncbi:MAG: potassium-transporting ATPase subunit KdpC [Polyangiaceae bacterium]
MTPLIRPALTLLVLLSALTGIVYPLTVTAVAQLAFPNQANGSLLGKHGSRLIGQPFDDPRYFWGRPSATTPAYNAAASSGSNLGPSNPALTRAVAERVGALRAADAQGPVPVDLVTSSASGLDPHISPAAALFQVRRVARARQLDEALLQRLVEARVEGRTWGVLGEPVVNVLALNLALDQLD